MFYKEFEVSLSRFVNRWGTWDFVPLPHVITLSTPITMNGGVVSCDDQGWQEGLLDEGVYKLIGSSMK